MTTIPTGRFVWFEHVSKTPEKAQGFLGELFNWSIQAMPMPQGGSYSMIKVGDATVGGFPTVPGNVNVPPHWVSHLQVTNAAETAKQVKSLGGSVLVEPVDMGLGTYALVADPLGGAFALWQPAQAQGTGDFKGVSGSFCWNELFSEDPARSAAFYAAIGGFTVKEQDMGPMGVYRVLEADGKPRAGILKTPMPGIPQSWLPYVQVDNADATHAKATKLGAETKVPPMDIPGVGRFSIFTDATGAAIGILQPAPQA